MIIIRNQPGKLPELIEKGDFKEELADVLFCIHELRDLIDTDVLWETVFRKHPRWLSRLEGKA